MIPTIPLGFTVSVAEKEGATLCTEGGKTGITAMTTGVAFFVSIFFAPIFASIPSWATGAALVIVGALMMRNVLEINWDYIGDAIPAFLTIVMIPLTFKYASFPHLGSCLRGDKLTSNTQHCIWYHCGHMYVHVA